MSNKEKKPTLAIQDSEGNEYVVYTPTVTLTIPDSKGKYKGFLISVAHLNEALDTYIDSGKFVIYPNSR